MLTTNDTGILIVCTGHPYYGNMSYCLALSIKSVAPDTQIACVWSDLSLSHLTAQQVAVFDHKIELPATIPGGFGVKLHLDELTPFDKTLYLDADMLWLGKQPADLFRELNGVPFTIITEGNSDIPNPKYYFWADAKEIQDVYGVTKIWQTRSEVMYWEEGCKVFEKARSLNPGVSLNTVRRFGTFVPDELHFNIAMALLGINPHRPKWMPAYWSRLHGEIMPNLSVLYREYYLLSFGSNAASPVMKRAYDNVMTVVCNKAKVPYQFRLKSKKEWAPGRLKI